MKHKLIASILILMLGWQVGVWSQDETRFDNSEAISSFRKTLLEWWDEKHRQMVSQPGGVWRGFYHSPPAMIYLSGWIIERNEVWKEDAKRQLEYALSQANPDGLSPALNYPYLTRDGLSREGIFVYAAYQILKDPAYLSWVDKLALAMMEKLKRSPHTYNGKDYILFHVQYEKIPPYKPVSGNGIDPNQNAEIGLLFTMLYHDPNSVLYQNPSAKDIAYNELSASMALQEETGELSLAEWEMHKYDTGYGTYSILLWLWANRYWHDPEFQEHVELGGKWLSGWMNPERMAEHFYPNYSFNQPWSTELWWRLAIYYENGIDTSNFISYCYYQQWLDPSTIVFLYLTGVPSSIYLVNFSPVVPLEPLPVEGNWINVYTTNGIKNSGFERNLPGSWKVRNAWRDNLISYSGLYSLRISENGIKDWEDYAYQGRIGILPNTSYKLTGYSKSTSGFGWGAVKIKIYDSGGRLLKEYLGYFLASPYWVKIGKWFTSPSGASYADVYFYNRSGVKNKDVLLDNLQFSSSRTYNYEDVFDYKWWDRQDLMYNLAVGYIDVWDKDQRHGDQYLYSNLDFENFIMEWEQARLSNAAGQEEYSWIIFHADAKDLTNYKAFLLVPPEEDYSWHRYKLIVEGNYADLYRDGSLVSNIPTISGNAPQKGRVGFLHYYGFHFGIRNISMRPPEP